MKKIFSFLLLTCLLLIGTNVWAAEVTDVITPSVIGISGGSYQSWSGKTCNSDAVYAGQSSAGTDIQLRSNNNNSGIITTATGGTVKSITVVWHANTVAGRTLNVYGKNSAYENPTDLYGDNAGDLLGTIKKGTSTSITVEGSYAFIGLRANSGAMYISSITIVWEDGSSQTTCATPIITGTDNFYEFTEVTITSTTGASIYYTLDGSTPTTSSTPYSEPFVISETTIVKAIATKAGLTDSEIGSNTFTKATILTVAQAHAALAVVSPVNDQYVHGIVSQIDSYSNGAITYWISDDGTTTNQLEVYKGKNLNNVNFEAQTDLHLGDIVTVHGNLKIYNEVDEFDSYSSLVYFERPAVPSIDVEETSINATAEEAEGTITVTYNNITNVAAEVYFCNAAGTEAATYDWVDADINASNNVEYLIEANTGAARTAYMKVWAYDDEFNAVYSEIITISQEAYVAPFVITDGVFDFDQNEDYGSGLAKSGVKLQTSTWTAINVTMVMAGRNCWNDYSGAVSQIRLYKASGDSPSGNITFSVPEGNIITNIAFTGSDLHKMGAEEGTYVVASGNKSASWNGFANSVLFTATDRTDIYTIEVTYSASASITLGTNGYSTFAAPFKYTVSGAEVYEAALNNAQNAIILTKVENAIVPANAGIILKGTEGATVTITPSNAAASDFAGNELVGVLTPTLAEANWYVLATNLDGDGLTKFHNCKAGIEIPANKAYMVIGEATAPSIRIIEAGNEATDIQNVEGAEKAVKFMENGKLYIQKNGVVYDAMGKTVR